MSQASLFTKNLVVIIIEGDSVLYHKNGGIISDQPTFNYSPFNKYGKHTRISLKACSTQKGGQKNGHLLGFLPRTYFCLFLIFVPSLEIILFIIHFFQYVYLSTMKISALMMGQKVRGVVFIQTISAKTAQKREQQQQQQQRVSAYYFVRLLGVCDGFCHILMSFMCVHVQSCTFPGVSVCYFLFSMHPNFVLLGIICLCYGLESAFVVDSSILLVLNVIALDPPQLYVSYSYKWAFYKSKNWYLNAILFLS